MKTAVLTVAITSSAFLAGCRPSAKISSVHLYDLGGWGGYECFLEAEGMSTIRVIRPGERGLEEDRYEFILSPPEARELEAVILAHRPELISIPARLRFAGEGRVTIVIVYRSGPLLTLSKWEGDDHKDFDAIRDHLVRLCKDHGRGKPTHTGTLDEDWQPEGMVLRKVQNLPDLVAGSRQAADLLWEAARYGDRKAVQVLLDMGVPVTDAPLAAAATGSHKDLMRLFVAKGADVNSGEMLIWAVIREKPEVVRLLLDLGADPNVPNDLGVTALEYALGMNQPKVAHLLWKRGTTLNIRTAAGLGQDDYIAAALKKGTSVDERQKRWGTTPLIYAARSNQHKTARFLLSHKAKVNLADTMDRKTPLHWAASHGHVEVARVLLAAGAAVNSTDCNGDTPVDVAQIWGHSAVIELLSEHGGRPNRRP